MKMAEVTELANEPTLAVVKQAADWHVKRHSAEITTEEIVAFEQWQNQHSTHALAYKRFEALWGKFNDLHNKPALAALEFALKPTLKPISQSRKKRLIKPVLLSLLTGVIISSVVMQNQARQYLLADYHTAVGQQKTVELADHSRVTLNTNSAIDIDYSQYQRRVILRQGEILLEVTKDTTRPFMVETPQGTARALGTKYVVNRDADVTTVSVIESVVEACMANTKASRVCERLQAGDSAKIFSNRLQRQPKVDVQSVASWKEGVLAVDNRPLAEVLTELERYRYGRIYFNAAEMSDIKVSGVFPLSDTHRSLTVLQETLPISIKHYTPLLLVVKHR